MRYLILIFALLQLTACCTNNTCTGTQQTTIDSLEQLQCLQGSKPCASSKCGDNTMRMQALRDTAMTIGAQAGLSWRAKQINCALDKQSSNLDKIFNFSLMMLPHNILPPVLSEGRSILNIDDDTTIRIADRTYQIVSQARFVTTPPNWRDYLWQSYERPEVPFGSLLPQNCNERQIWKTYSAMGWNEGVTQADGIYVSSLNRLKRDFTGMIRYRELLMQNMVSAPFVSRTELGITGTCDDMRINDQVLRITALPCLQQNSKCWNPVVDP